MSTMEVDRPKLGTTSSQTQEAIVDPNNLVDRFSDLPAEVVLKIISMMSPPELIDLIRVRCVSKRYRRLGLSVSSLHINGFLSKYKRFRLQRLNFLNHVDRFLMQHGDFSLERLSIAWTFSGAKRGEQFRVSTWLCTVTRCNVHEVKLVFCNVDEGSGFELPYDFLACSSLRTLKVDLEYMSLKVPSFAVPSNLQHLHLRNVTTSEDVCKWISSLPLAEMLLQHVNGVENVTIEIPSLRKFYLLLVTYNNRISRIRISCDKLEDLNVTGPFRCRGIDSFEIVAPNLRRVRLQGYLMNNPSLGRFPYLEKAELFIYSTNNTAGNLYEILKSASTTKFLHIDDKAIQDFRVGAALALSNISCFRANLLCMNDDNIPSIAYLLQGMPNLNKLFIGSSPQSLRYEFHPHYYYFYSKYFPFGNRRIMATPPEGGYRKSYWESQNLACIDELKEVRIELSGTQESEFALYVLENAPNLKQMDIVHSYHQSPFVRKIKQCNRKSCDARVLIYMRKKLKAKDFTNDRSDGF